MYSEQPTQQQSQDNYNSYNINPNINNSSLYSRDRRKSKN